MAGRYKKLRDAKILSMITSSDEQLVGDYNQSIDLIAYTMISITGQGQVYSGSGFSDLLNSVNNSKTKLVYVDDLGFNALYIIKQLIKLGYQPFRGFEVLNNTTCGWFKIFNHNENFYSINIRFPNSKRTVEFRDAFQMTRQYGFKLVGVDYSKLNKSGAAYCFKLSRDIVFRIQPLLFGLWKDGSAGCVTIGQFSFNKMLGYIKNNTKLFPQLDNDLYYELKPGYRGGFVYCNKKFRGKHVRDIKAYDCNKLYSSMMYKHVFPCHHPVERSRLEQIGCKLQYCQDAYKFRLVNDNDTLFICRAVVTAVVAPNHIPCFDAVGISNLCGSTNEYDDRFFSQELILTNVDVDLLFDNYLFPDDSCFKIEKLWVFSKCEPFDEFVEHYFEQCNKCQRGTAEYQVNKLILECAYGKFASKPIVSNNTLVNRDGDWVFDNITMTDDDPQTRNYLPVAMFITSYGRKYIVDIANKNFDNLIYIDTDSIHLINNAAPVGIEIGSGLGQFKIEHDEEEGIYFGPKVYSYLDSSDSQFHLKASGLNMNSVKIDSLDELLGDRQFDNVVKCKCREGRAYRRVKYSVSK